MSLSAFLSATTCGEACWSAREDVCRCSCCGKNHGCTRTPEGARPVRSSKIDGIRYELKAVGYRLHDEAMAINRAAGVTYYHADTARDRHYRGVPAKVRPATKGQIERWPELAAYRENLPDEWRRNNPEKCMADWPGLPYLLWVRSAEGAPP